MMNTARQDQLISINNASLPKLPKTVLRPTYERSALTRGIVHIGIGNFHRAHQSWYLHRLMQQGLAHDWAIIGAGVRAYDSIMREKLLAQDCLTTLIELDPSGTSAEVVGSMIDYIPVEEDNQSLIKTMADPAIRIVSLTVTEGGYYFDQNKGGLDINDQDIQYDIKNPNTPRTAFGAMVAALKIRWENGLKPFTGQSCDNLQGNGDILRAAVVSLAEFSNPELAQWIIENGAFPNSMVDCIVPSTGEKELALANDFGIIDAAPVSHENFRQWVIEDEFCDGRPDWDKVGATFTQKVHEYETMKIRMLNAGHQVLANVGELLSQKTISSCMENPLIAEFFEKIEREEIAPYVSPVPKMTPEGYLNLISTRFSNSEIYDTTRRVAYDGSSRHLGFVLPILRDALKANGSIDGLALVEALWARMCAGNREDGSTIEANDPHWPNLNRTALNAKDNPALWLQQRQIYGDLATNQRFSAAFENCLNQLWSKGVVNTLKTYLDAG